MQVVHKILKITVPTLLGMIAQISFGYLVESQPNSEDDIDLLCHKIIFFPLVLFLILCQLVFVLPIWNKYKANIRLFNLSLPLLISTSGILSGLCFGLLLWSSKLGIKDFLIWSLIFTSSFLIYFVFNFSTLFLLEKVIIKTNVPHNS